MFRKNTLFILGAGSSHEVGLPVGETLKSLVAENIDIKFSNGFNQDSGNGRITQALRRIAASKNLGWSDINPYLKKASALNKALPLSISIDNLLDAHKNDGHTVLCGKLGIIASILEAELGSKLHPDKHTDRIINHTKLKNSWFSELTKLLTENVTKEEIGDIFKNVSFINFNYDRCLEFYLFDAIKTYYNLNYSEVVETLNNLKVIRPYGRVGKLNWQMGAAPIVEFGQSNYDLFPLKDEIQTFNEKIIDSESMDFIKETVGKAEHIVFLGFAYHSQNLKLLFPSGPSTTKTVLGTAFGVSDSDCGLLVPKLKQALSLSHHSKIHLEQGLKCNQLLKDYFRLLTS